MSRKENSQRQSQFIRLLSFFFTLSLHCTPAAEQAIACRLGMGSSGQQQARASRADSLFLFVDL
jgi:hypothetical protein